MTQPQQLAVDALAKAVGLTLTPEEAAELAPVISALIEAVDAAAGWGFGGPEPAVGFKPQDV